VKKFGDGDFNFTLDPDPLKKIADPDAASQEFSDLDPQP